MENRVYYGEYSVRRWIELVLTKNIVLPEYQRSFVWDRDKIAALIETFRDNRFVPPIILGSYTKADGASVNYVIDGQQRLSSLILAYIKKFPKKGAFPRIQNLASDEDADEDDDEPIELGRDWTFRDVAQGVVEAPVQLSVRCGDDKYEDLDVSLDDVDLDKTFIGFCYLVPGSDDENGRIRYYTRTFREVNIGGVSLSPQESRRSLYYLKNDKKSFFEPAWVPRYTLLIKGKTVQRQILDFVRYAALFFDYLKHECDESMVARGQRKKTMEKYFEDFVYSVVDNRKSEVFCKFSEVFRNSVFAPDMQRLAEQVELLSPPAEYDSIIDMDVYFMGLIYVVLLKKKKLREDKISELKIKLVALIDGFRNNAAHKKSPGSLKYLRARLAASVDAFKEVV